MIALTLHQFSFHPKREGKPLQTKSGAHLSPTWQQFPSQAGSQTSSDWAMPVPLPDGLPYFHPKREAWPLLTFLLRKRRLRVNVFPSQAGGLASSNRAIVQAEVLQDNISIPTGLLCLC